MVKTAQLKEIVYLNLWVIQSDNTKSVNYKVHVEDIQEAKQEILLSEVRQNERLESINLKLFIRLQGSV